jgi:hypothetical protein
MRLIDGASFLERLATGSPQRRVKSGLLIADEFFCFLAWREREDTLVIHLLGFFRYFYTFYTSMPLALSFPNADFIGRKNRPINNRDE